MRSNKVVDAQGLSCPMPIVKTKKAMNEVKTGEVVEVLATDRGSLADIKSWCKAVGHQYIGSLEEGAVLKHYIRKSGLSDTKKEKKFSKTIQNEELQKKMEAGERLVVLDVREPAEYLFEHIPGSKTIPLGELEERYAELNTSDDIYVICRSGSRSDLAARILAAHGFTKVTNVLPGMSEWTSPKETNQ